MTDKHETNKPKVIIICGPTGIGKTAFAIKLAQKFSGEIINSDSMQIYKYMDIGTAKPSEEERAAVPHCMIDIVTPDQAFDAAIFASLAAIEEERIRKSQKPVFMVGGTGLYLRAFTNGLFRCEPASGAPLDILKAIAEEKGAAFLHKKLSEIDRVASEKIHPNDTFRIIRALEYFEKTGRPISESWDCHGFRDSKYEILKICIGMDRAVLYEKINRRVEIMIEQGFCDEVRMLLEMGYSNNLKSMKSIGYRHMCEYIDGKTGIEKTVETLKQDTRRYAKRQFTWFRHETGCIWLAPDEIQRAADMVKEFIS